MHAVIAHTDQLRAAAAALIAGQYAAAGLAGRPQLPDGPASVTLVALDGGAVMGTMTLTVDSDAGLLADKTFRAEIESRSKYGRRACEITKLACDPAARSKDALAALLDMAYTYGRTRGCTDVFIEVHPRHARFYERMLGFVKAGPERLNTRVNAPAVLLWLDADYMGRQIALYAGTAGAPGASRSLYPYFPTLTGKHNGNSTDDAQILVARVHPGHAETQGKAG